MEDQVAQSQQDLMQALHAEHSHALWLFCCHLTHGDRQRAEDLVQETLLRAWRTPRVLDQSAGSSRAWLFTVARHLVIDEWRSARFRSEQPADHLPEPPSADQVDRLLDSWLVAEALARLSEDHRAVIVECFYRGRSVAEAAQALGVPEGTVKSRTHYALRGLRLQLQEMGVSA